MTGATCLQGPHHDAQKSTSTGTSDFKTSSSNVSAVTATGSDIFYLLILLICSLVYFVVKGIGHAIMKITKPARAAIMNPGAGPRVCGRTYPVNSATPTLEHTKEHVPASNAVVSPDRNAAPSRPVPLTEILLPVIFVFREKAGG
jgi:hypothetical protein